MTQQGPDSADPVPDDSWSSRDPSWAGSNATGSSLGNSSLDDAREAAARDHEAARADEAPNPFSREAAPEEALGADIPAVPPASAGSAAELGGAPAVVPPATLPPAQARPSYPTEPPAGRAAPANPYGGAANPYGYDTGADDYQGSSGYGDGAQPYGAPPSPGNPPPPYGSVPPSYGSAPSPYGSAPSPYGNDPSPYGGNPAGYSTPPAAYGDNRAYGTAPDPTSGEAPPAYGAPAGYPQTPAYGTNPYEVNPYQAAYGSSSPYGLVPQTHPQATVALILGIVGMVLCPVVGIAGLVVGSRSRKQIDAEPQRYTGRGLATAGVVLGVISIVVGVLWVIFFALGLSGAFDS